MRHIICLNWALLFAFGVFAGPPTWAAPSPVVISLTKQLPDADKVEIELVHVNFETIDKVIDKKTLQGDQAKKVITGWRSLDFNYDASVECHAPAYRFRFFSHGALLTEATVCFRCHNIYFYKYPGAKSPNDHLEVVFGIDLTSGQETRPGKGLQAFLEHLFSPGTPALNT